MTFSLRNHSDRIMASQTKMSSELYTQFEDDANEVVFGQKRAPDRPLTDKEISEKKRIILKLVDQKLKFELIELMRRQQEQTDALNIHLTSTQTTPSTHADFTAWNYMSSNYGSQNFNPQSRFGNPWQLPTHHSQQSGYEYRFTIPHCRQQNSNLIHLRTGPLTSVETRCTSTGRSTTNTSKGISSISTKISSEVKSTTKTKPLYSVRKITFKI